MAEALQFELVSPERVLASEPVGMVVLPGAEGDFGVLPLHAPFMSLLRPGVIATYEGDRVVRRIFVAGGFAEVNEKSCIVLAEGAEPVEEIDPRAARQALADAQEDLADAREPGEAERERLETAVRVAEARLEAAGEGTAAAH
jgi:F-type H+-transporting ATPase subunit epsilon